MTWTSNFIPYWVTVSAVIGTGFAVLLLALNLYSAPRETKWEFETKEGNKRLAVLVHGLPGRGRFEAAVRLSREALPDSDLLIVDYDSRPFSKASPYSLANVLEKKIYETHKEKNYDEILLMGYSIGGMLVRKAFLWGSGLEEDRQQYGKHGKREWVDSVTRFVSLAGINRGWSVDPRPKNMSIKKLAVIRISERLAKLSFTGQLMLSLKKGSPFVADSRVQWITLCRGELSEHLHVPQTIHLLGDRDDIVSKEDSMDLSAAQDIIFVTLQDTGHREIAAVLDGEAGKSARHRMEQIRFRYGENSTNLIRTRPRCLKRIHMFDESFI